MGEDEQLIPLQKRTLQPKEEADFRRIMFRAMPLGFNGEEVILTKQSNAPT